MSLIIGLDEIASETHVSEGWSYALFSTASLASIQTAVASCAVKTFHGKKFKTSQTPDYECFLHAVRHELDKPEEAGVVFTLMDSKWKNTLVPFAPKLIQGSFTKAGISDAEQSG